MHKEEYYRLITLHLSGEISEADQKKLNLWLNQSPDHMHIYTEVVLAWKAAGLQYEAFHSEKAFGKIKEIIDADGYKKRPENLPVFIKTPFFKIAATFSLLVIAAALFLLNYDNTPGEHLLTRQTSYGEKTKIILDDSSVVWLNAKSSFQYPALFTEATREVYLTGEAFFEVTPNPEKPFIIHLTDKNQIKVLGTSFNVKSYAEDNSIETTVETGKVAFISQTENHPDSILIQPDNKISFLKDSGKLVQQKANIEADMAWLNGKLIFDQTPLNEIAHTLVRTYGVTIDFENEALKNCQLTGTFQQQSWEEILQILGMTKAFEYEIVGEKIKISGIGCKMMFNQK